MLTKLRTLKTTLLLCCLGLWQHASAAPDQWQMNMYQGVTPLSKEMYDLHMIAIWICTAIGVVVFGVMLYALIRHRKSRGYVPAVFHENTKLEIIWSIIPFIILVALAIPATLVLQRMEDTNDADITIKIVGYQWKWQYSYLDNNISFFSNLSTPYTQIQNRDPKNPWYLLEVDRPLVVPIHKKIRFLVTSNDVVHSWWVPELGVKRDAIPGFIHEAWTRIEKPGIYRGQCAELCGVYHGFMPIVVQALPEDQYQQWIASQSQINEKTNKTLTRDELMTLGKAKYETYCAACHQANGLGIPPLFPALKGSSVAVGYPISRHINLILEGVSGTAMQPYRDQLTDEEVAAIVTYERNAWENNTNDEVQPQDVAEVRQAHQKTPTKVNKAKAGGFQ